MSVFGWRHPREQVGYIRVGLAAHCVLGGRCIDQITDSLCTLANPKHRGMTAIRDLLFQDYQEWDCLTRTLRSEGLTVEALIGRIAAGIHKPFFSALAKQAVWDANFRDCRVPPSVRVHLLTGKETP